MMDDLLRRGSAQVLEGEAHVHPRGREYVQCSFNFLPRSIKINKKIE